MKALIVLPAPTVWCNDCDSLIFEAQGDIPVTVADLAAVENEHATEHLQRNLRDFRVMEGI
jgi:hypothetical protein